MTRDEAKALKVGALVAGDDKYGLTTGQVTFVGEDHMGCGYADIRFDDAGTGLPMSYTVPVAFDDMEDMRRATPEDKATRLARQAAHARRTS